MTEKRFNIKPQDDYWAIVDDYIEDKVCIINGIHTKIEAIWLCDFMNDQQSIIHRDERSIKTMMSNMKKLEEENEQLRKENVFLAKQRNYWKSKCAEWMGVKEENLSLRCVNMGDERFVCIDIGYGDDWYITDDGKRLSEMEIVDLLNEMNEDIQYLNAFLVEHGLAEEYMRWKGDV